MNKKLDEFKDKLKNKKIAIIGAGKSNKPLLEYFSQLNYDLTLFDEKEEKELDKNILKLLKQNKIPTFLGKDSLQKLTHFDIIFRSPSCLPTNPYLKKAASQGALITSEIEQVLKLAPCKIIGITGSKGKTTTTTITANILKKLGYKVHVGGNIGTSLFPELNNIKENDLIVLELSSFQLMNLEISPNISIITNISPDHLDIHSSYEEYITAKKNIFKNQTPSDTLVLNYDDEIVKNFAQEAVSKIKYFSKTTKLKNSYILDNNYIKYIDNNNQEKIIIDTSKIVLKGSHNYLNICACLNAIDEYIDQDKIFNILKDFSGVEHRLEFVREINHVKWYNDSASTTPDKAIAGITAFNKKITLIAGGYDKNLDYTPLAKIIIKKVDKLILFGDTKNKIYNKVRELIQNTNQTNDIEIYVMDTLEEVIEVAYQVTSPHSVVLFSPASASFDMFKNAYQRGEKFKKLISKL